uniref:protein-disulfide reductase n=1 Tax=Globisporangium ultimum (strain ATCC 200006 / CBS 805.95 / DAOM BR144) TaxID=431595 RepID=K3WGP4_GLOUD
MSNATWTTELFGAELLIKDGLQPIAKVLVDKTLIGVYCAPCRTLTPVLSQTYDDLSEELADAVEIVFVSFGKDQDAFDEYYCEMPFAALPFDKTSKQREVVANQMPRLIGHPAVGNVLTKKGDKRARAAEDDTEKLWTQFMSCKKWSLVVVERLAWLRNY